MTPGEVGRTVSERHAPLDIPLWSHPGWTESFPWLVQGTTGRGDGEEPWDPGLAGAQPVGEVLGRWGELRRALAMRAAAHSRQVHGAELLAHPGPVVPGLHLTEGYDGHVTMQAGALLTVSAADCVPVSLVDSERRIIALVHAGWRGIAAGIVQAAFDRFVALGSRPADLRGVLRGRPGGTPRDPS